MALGDELMDQAFKRTRAGRLVPAGFRRRREYIPIQMAIVLSANRDIHESEKEGFRGGEFLFCDVPESKKSSRRTIAAGQGDALLFCTRDRLERVGGVFGLQAVKHGVNEITEGTRVVLGVPFHEYRWYLGGWLDL